ncbi:MAG: hypothetical protein FWC11_05050 [Firmicutes bacterium]|nr:hypothetical protein [Bacillota bacterium]
MKKIKILFAVVLVFALSLAVLTACPSVYTNHTVNWTATGATVNATVDGSAIVSGADVRQGSNIAFSWATPAEGYRMRITVGSNAPTYHERGVTTWTHSNLRANATIVFAVVPVATEETPGYPEPGEPEPGEPGTPDEVTTTIWIYNTNNHFNIPHIHAWHGTPATNIFGSLQEMRPMVRDGETNWWSLTFEHDPRPDNLPHYSGNPFHFQVWSDMYEAGGNNIYFQSSYHIWQTNNYFQLLSNPNRLVRLAERVVETPTPVHTNLIEGVREQRAPSTSFYGVVSAEIEENELEVTVSHLATQIAVNFIRAEGLLGNNFNITSGDVVIHAYELRGQGDSREFRRFGSTDDNAWIATRPTQAAFVYEGHFGNDFYIVINAFNRSIPLTINGADGSTTQVKIDITVEPLIDSVRGAVAGSNNFYELDYTVDRNIVNVTTRENQDRIAVNFNRIDGMLGEDFSFRARVSDGDWIENGRALEMNANRQFRIYGTDGEFVAENDRFDEFGNFVMFAYSEDGYFGNDFYIILNAPDNRSIEIEFTFNDGRTFSAIINITVPVTV